MGETLRCGALGLVKQPSTNIMAETVHSHRELYEGLAPAFDG